MNNQGQETMKGFFRFFKCVASSERISSTLLFFTGSRSKINPPIILYKERKLGLNTCTQMYPESKLKVPYKWITENHYTTQ